MRDIATLIRRVQADLPISVEEVAALTRHLDERTQRHRKTERAIFAAIALIGLLTAGLVAGKYAGLL